MYSRSAKGGGKGYPNRSPWLAKMPSQWRQGCRKGYNKKIQVSFDSNICILILMYWGVFAISAAHLYQNYLEELPPPPPPPPHQPL